MKRLEFTLIEMLIVVAVISILVSLLLPALKRAGEKADGIACLSQLRQLGVVDQNYTSDNRGIWSVMGQMEYFHPGNGTTYSIYYPQFYWRQGYLAPSHGSGSPGTFYIGKAYCCPGLVKHFSLPNNAGRYLSLYCYATRADIRRGFGDDRLDVTSLLYLRSVGVMDLSKARRPAAFNLRGCSSIGQTKVNGLQRYCMLASSKAPAGIHSRNANMIFLDGHAEAVSRTRMILEFGGDSTSVYNCLR